MKVIPATYHAQYIYDFNANTVYQYIIRIYVNNI